jgi:hypothetical protein
MSEINCGINAFVNEKQTDIKNMANALKLKEAYFR